MIYNHEHYKHKDYTVYTQFSLAPRGVNAPVTVT